MPQGQGCSCVDLFIHFALLAGIIPGVIAGNRFALRHGGSWGLRVAGWIGGGIAGGLAGILLGMLTVAVIGLVAFVAVGIEERLAARKAAVDTSRDLEN